LEGWATIKLASCFFEIRIILFMRTLPSLGTIGKAKLVIGVARNPYICPVRMQVSALARVERFF